MNTFHNRRGILKTGLALCAALVLPQARACEFYTSTLRITHPWTRATEPNATTAVLCMKIDQVTVTDRLIGVETPVASGAELIRDGASSALNLTLPIGSETLLSEDGMHVRLVGLKHPLLTGRSYPLVLVFAKGGNVNAELNVDYESKPYAPLGASPL